MKYLTPILICLLCLLAFNSQGQKAKISFVYYSDTSDIGMKREVEFPIVNSGNIAIDSILNKNIRRDILFDTLSTPIDSVLSNLVAASSSFWLVSEITFNKKNII